MSKGRVVLPWFIGYRFSSAGRGSKLMSFITSISTAGLALGVALLVLVVAVMNGFDRELRTKILSVVPQVSIYHRDGIDNWQQTLADITALPQAQGVVAASPFVQLEGMISHNGLVQPVLVYGIEPELETTVSHLELFVDPELLDQVSQDPSSIILGADLAAKLSLSVGDTFSLVVPKPNGGGRSAGVKYLRLAGLLRTGTELDQGMGLMGLASAAELSTVGGNVSGIRLRLDDLFQAPQLAREVVSALPFGYYSSDWTRTHGNLYHAVQMSSNLVWLLLVLIIGIAVFNVVSTLVLAVVEKQGNIAILRTLGTSPKQILSIFMVQGLLIGCVGTALGLVVGMALTQVAATVVGWIEALFGSKLLTSEIYPVSYLPIDNRWSDIAFIGITALALSVLASLYPAWRASRVQPADALRYD
ncbi:lipoprotein-releasing ABC transporter permease subunit [Halioxenophilus aromaticivorans]|uniref:Lipoprotein-releasing ABC transporter permease subunit n=1 Tax=Halioxenophilus aromaticivorans TaxID=1306992 RepID=A0AAV3TY12_9ALTE